MDRNLPLLAQGSYNSVITYILLGPIYIQMVSILSDNELEYDLDFQLVDLFIFTLLQIFA